MPNDDIGTFLGHLARRSAGELAPEHIANDPGMRVIGAGLRLPVRPATPAEYDPEYLEQTAPRIECFEARADGSRCCRCYGGGDECPPAEPRGRPGPEREPDPTLDECEPSPTPEPTTDGTPPKHDFGGVHIEPTPKGLSFLGWKLVRGN